MVGGAASRGAARVGGAAKPRSPPPPPPTGHWRQRASQLVRVHVRAKGGGELQRREGRVSAGMVGFGLARRVVDAWRGATWWCCGEGCEGSTPKLGCSCRHCSPAGIEKLLRLRPLSQNVGDLLVFLPHDCSHPCGVNGGAMVGSSPLLFIGLPRFGREVTAILRIGAPHRLGTM